MTLIDFNSINKVDKYDEYINLRLFKLKDDFFTTDTKHLIMSFKDTEVPDAVYSIDLRKNHDGTYTSFLEAKTPQGYVNSSETFTSLTDAIKDAKTLFKYANEQ